MDLRNGPFPGLARALASAIALVPILALAGLAGAARSPDCAVQSERIATVGTPAEFSLTCDLPSGTLVAWDFGDGDTLDYANRPKASHAYQTPGSYTVFARIQGEDIPASAYLTVINSPSAVPPTRSTTLLLDRRRGRLWNVNVDNHSVSVISAASRTRIKEIPVGRAPRTLAQDTLGRIWVANQDDATLTVLDGESLEVLRTIALPRASRPFGICFDPSGHNLYVTLEALGSLIRLDQATGRILDSLALFPTPRGIAAAPDGKTLWVTRFISPQDHGEVAQVTAIPFAVKRMVSLAHDQHQDTESNGRGVPNALSFVALSPDGLRAWLPFKKDNVVRGMRLSGGAGGSPDPEGPQVPTFESTVRTVVAQLDAVAGHEIIGLRIDLDNRSMARAVAFSRGGAFAFVATETSNEIAVIDATENVRVTAIEPREEGHELGPDGLEVSPGDSLLYVHDFMSREIAVYDISEAGGSNLMPRLALIPTVEKEALAPAVLRGKQIFYNAADPRMSRHKYLACAACHMDGGSDGRVWDFTHKGEGLRRTTSLLGKAGLGQGPLHWSANFDELQDFEHDMRDAFEGTGFLDDAAFDQGTRNRSLGDRKTGLSPALDDLAAYVSSLARTRPSPFRRADGSLTADAVEGGKIFNRSDVGCAVCHVPPLYTDSRLVPPPPAASAAGPASTAGPASAAGGFLTAEGYLLHDVGTLKPESGRRLGDTLKGLDTPTLLGLWETKAYLHDGSAATLMDVLTTANPADRHGKTSHLTTQEKRQLEAFLMQIEDAVDPSSIRLSTPGSKRSGAPGLSLTASRIDGGMRITLTGPAGGPQPTLEIMSLSGRHIRKFSPKEFGDATETAWTVSWDGRDDQNRPQPPGMVLVHARKSSHRAVTALTWIP